MGEYFWSVHRWAEFRSLVRRCICLIYIFVIGGRSFLASIGGVCCVIDHIVCACLLYVVNNTVMTYFAALTMCVVVVSFEEVSSCRSSDAFSRVGWVLASPRR